MAFVNQEKKKKIADKLKRVVPKDWKYSLAVHNHSTIALTIWSAPIDLSANAKHYQLNHYHLKTIFNGELLEIFKNILAALNTDNYDHSDTMTDYFEVGHYIAINLGRWDKPFMKTGSSTQAILTA